MGRYWVVLGNAGSVWWGTGWHLVVLGQYNLVPFSIKQYWVSKVFLCQYILKKWRFGQASPIPGTHTHTDKRI